MVGRGESVCEAMRMRSITRHTNLAYSRTLPNRTSRLETHPPAERTAPAVARLLSAGADLVGKTQMDELAWSLQGNAVQVDIRLTLG